MYKTWALNIILTILFLYASFVPVGWIPALLNSLPGTLLNNSTRHKKTCRNNTPPLFDGQNIIYSRVFCEIAVMFFFEETLVEQAGELVEAPSFCFPLKKKKHILSWISLWLKLGWLFIQIQFNSKRVTIS